MLRAGVLALAATGATLTLMTTASGASTAAPAAAPNAVPDQGNPYRAAPCRLSGWIPDDTTSWAAQTFTAGITGTLTDVVVRLQAVNPQFALVVTPVDAVGFPVLAAPLTTSIVKSTPSKSYADVAVSFGSPAKVEAGKRYALVLLVPTGTFDSYVAWGADFGANVRDSTGAACADGAYAGGRAWGKGFTPPGPQADYFFQTFVVPAKRVVLLVRKTGSGSVASRPAGIACGTRCRFAFVPGAVTLVARPATGWRFQRWQGACRGTKPTCSLRLAAAASATAVFAR